MRTKKANEGVSPSEEQSIGHGRVARPVETAFARRRMPDGRGPPRCHTEILAWRLDSPPGGTLLESRYVSSVPGTIKETTMKYPLESIWGTIICGLILTVVLYWAAQALLH